MRLGQSSSVQMATSSPQQHRTLQKLNSWETPSSKNINNAAAAGTSRGVSLDGIVTEYLMNQHALCKNPMVTCPQFDLFHPHKCPDARSKNTAPTNFTARMERRAIFLPHGGLYGIHLRRNQFLYLLHAELFQAKVDFIPQMNVPPVLCYLLKLMSRYFTSAISEQFETMYCF